MTKIGQNNPFLFTVYASILTKPLFAPIYGIRILTICKATPRARYFKGSVSSIYVQETYCIDGWRINKPTAKLKSINIKS